MFSSVMNAVIKLLLSQGNKINWIRGRLPEKVVQCGHKSGKLREFEKLGKSQGNLNFVGKNLENSGKMKFCDMIANKNAFHQIFLSSCSGNFVSQKCGHPVATDVMAQALNLSGSIFAWAFFFNNLCDKPNFGPLHVITE